MTLRNELITLLQGQWIEDGNSTGAVIGETDAARLADAVLAVCASTPLTVDQLMGSQLLWGNGEMFTMVGYTMSGDAVRVDWARQ